MLRLGQCVVLRTYISAERRAGVDYRRDLERDCELGARGW
jgi:hypothetical protein